MEHVRVVPVRVVRPDHDLQVNVRRVVGYRAEVKDGWHGPTRSTRQDAVADMAARRAEEREETRT